MIFLQVMIRQFYFFIRRFYKGTNYVFVMTCKQNTNNKSTKLEVKDKNKEFENFIIKLNFYLEHGCRQFIERIYSNISSKGGMQVRL